MAPHCHFGWSRPGYKSGPVTIRSSDSTSRSGSTLNLGGGWFLHDTIFGWSQHGYKSGPVTRRSEVEPKRLPLRTILGWAQAGYLSDTVIGFSPVDTTPGSTSSPLFCRWWANKVGPYHNFVPNPSRLCNWCLSVSTTPRPGARTSLSWAPLCPCLIAPLRSVPKDMLCRNRDIAPLVATMTSTIYLCRVYRSLLCIRLNATLIITAHFPASAAVFPLRTLPCFSCSTFDCWLRRSLKAKRNVWEPLV